MQDGRIQAGNPQSIERRLATILVADVFGYSRMMQENEERTVEVFRGHREIFDGLLRQHHGRIFNTAGDAVLAEFPSAVEAVRCATEIQTALRTRNEHLPPEQRMHFRIGINLGDVIIQGSDLLGDGVNVAARIQTVAEPGGVCISGSVYDQIQNKLTLQFVSLGERSFKNIVQPIRTFSITNVGNGTLPSISLWRRYVKRRLVVAGLSAVVLMAAVGGYWAYRTYDTQRIDEARIAAEKESRRAEDMVRMTAEAQRKAELERTAREAAEREARLQAELLAVKGKAEQERIAREAAQREAKLQVERERIASEAAQREAKLQVEREKIAREAAEREARLQAELKAAEAKLQQEEAAKKQAVQAALQQADAAKKEVAQAALQKDEAAKKQTAQQAVSTTVVPMKTSPAVSGPDRYNGTYKGQLCTKQDTGGTDQPFCRNIKVTVKQGTISGSWFSMASGKNAHLKGTITPEGAAKITIDAFDGKGRPMSCAMTGTWSDNTIKVSGKWRPRDIPVEAVLTREP